MTRVWIYTVFVIFVWLTIPTNKADYWPRIWSSPRNGLWSGVSEAGSCTARGRFPNENEPNCRGYTMCLSGAPGVYTQLDISCPDTFVYSHIDNQCTNITSYQCYPQYNCTSQGLYAEDKTLNCTKYIACVQGLNGIATARLVQCPENTLYSPLENACVNSTMFTCDNIEFDDLPNVVDALPSQESDHSNTNSAANLCFKYALLVYLMFILGSCMIEFY